MAGNRIELWGAIVGEPEFRLTPAGTATLRVTVDCTGREGDLKMAVVVTGAPAENARRQFRAGAQVRVAGSLRAARRRLKSGLFETAYEVTAESITAGN